ncbi:unnamed protein product [Vitrella brassicaformis CCMP3155]|uniref:Uncharacterized protein n=1 Tax=Vitrella brassicaformis (strain CCMP3155) TaxID=1169540 RepID=A0A0G4G108_VITBC|nr:unnamed protein product [Vitrella brassicaformis CCMP3155]|eukprot:CEM21324.1 unnamed protein product [Vitrella brassicaformis CCMP3155]
MSTHRRPTAQESLQRYVVVAPCRSGRWADPSKNLPDRSAEVVILQRLLFIMDDSLAYTNLWYFSTSLALVFFLMVHFSEWSSDWSSDILAVVALMFTLRLLQSATLNPHIGPLIL